ncbi:hypothetical protein BCEN4_740014 [Burkholderia cenocepacia]|nr:hypothetical protein BCEN4_740014 [Burkholderia cenocepacia]
MAILAIISKKLYLHLKMLMSNFTILV